MNRVRNVIIECSKQKGFFLINEERIKELFSTRNLIMHNIHTHDTHTDAYKNIIIYITHSYTNRIYNGIHTPNAEYRLVRLWLGWFKNTSDLGLGGFFGLSMTRVSSHISSSNNFESDDTDSCRLTRS